MGYRQTSVPCHSWAGTLTILLNVCVLVLLFILVLCLNVWVAVERVLRRAWAWLRAQWGQHYETGGPPKSL